MVITNLMAQITEAYSKMTKAEKKVADIVLSSPQDVLKATITDLSKMCHVGETSVFRFCRTLSLKGYQDFKLSLALSTANSTNSISKEFIDINDANDISDTSNMVLQAYKSALEITFGMLNLKSISKVVDLIIASDSIHLFGFGGSGTSANEAHNKFIKIISNVIYNADSHIQLTQAALLKKGDLAIIFSNSGITKDCITMAKICREAQASVVFVTQFSKTPAAPFSDVLLLCGANEGPLEGGSIAAKTSQLFLKDILYAETFRRLENEALKNKQKTSQIITEKMM